MKHSIALLPHAALLLAAVFVVLVMALQCACAPQSRAQRAAQKHHDDLGRAIVDAQNYHAKR